MSNAVDRKHGVNIFSFVYKLIYAIIVFAGVLDRAGIFTGDLQLQTLLSFTTISNIFVIAIALFTAIKYALHQNVFSPALAKVRYVGVILILVTGLVYHFILLPAKMEANPYYHIFTFGNIAAHYIAPFGMFADWLLFDKRGMITKREPLICAAAPVLYFIIAMTYGILGSVIPGKETSYVYFFMDIEKLGIMGVVKWVFTIFICILLLAYSVFAIDYILAKKKNTVSSK